MYEPRQIDATATKGRHTDRLYRRVDLGRDEPGIVVYDAALEDAVRGDIRAYIAAHLNLMERRSSQKVLEGELLWRGRPVEIPMPRR